MALGIQTPKNPPTSDQSIPTTLGNGARKPRSLGTKQIDYQHGFVLCSDQDAKPDRLVLCVYGPQKTGKDHFALTAPEPIFHQGIDPAGLEGVVEKFQKQKLIYRNPTDYYVDIDDDDASSPDKMAAAADRVWRQFVTDFQFALDKTDPKNNNGKAGTIIWSAESDAWELIRLARFGELAPKTGRDRGNVWGPVNAEYRRLLREPMTRGINFILIDKTKDEYANDKKTGAKIRSGFSDVPFMVQTVIRTYRSGAEFSAMIEDCRQDPSLNGIELAMGLNNFDVLRGMIP